MSNCSECGFYKPINGNTGNCLIDPPQFVDGSGVGVRNVDSWVHPIVFDDNFCYRLDDGSNELELVGEENEETPQGADSGEQLSEEDAQKALDEAMGTSTETKPEEKPVLSVKKSQSNRRGGRNK